MRQAGRCKGDLALLEGPHLVAEAIAAGVELVDVLASPQFLDSAPGRRLATTLAPSPVAVEAELLASLLDADSPRGLAAVARLPRAPLAALPHRAGGVYLYLAGIQDPGNLGALARSAEAAGAAGLVLAAGSAHPNHPRALRASAGSLLRLPVAVGVELEALVEHLAPLAPRRVALATRDGIDPWSADLTGTLILLLGAEGPGLPETLVRRAELALTIPLAGGVESLNVTVAASLVLFEIRRRRLAGGG
ncbi:MAG TPA: TrmH family RNA methyltransferase [Thermoanaerobaculia bacterium]|nr:TrmH family RNA methyltransferase [Thermoanaerobaculia bacterium]